MSKTKQAYELYLQGASYNEIADRLGVSHNTATSMVSAAKKRKYTTKGASEYPQAPAVCTCRDKTDYRDGSYTFESVKEGVLNGLSPIDIMIQKGLDPKLWEVVTFTTNSWQQQNGEGVVDLYQYKLIVRPAKKANLTIEDVDSYFKNMEYEPVDFQPIEYDSSKEVLEIDFADLHCGLLSLEEETGAAWDMDLCAERFLSGVNDLVFRCTNKRLSKVYICSLGDILHADNWFGTTTKGTQQDMDGRITRAIDKAYSTMNTALDMVKSLGVPVEVVYTCGNHDNILGYTLFKMLQINNPDIIFDITPNPQKAIHFGNVLVGLTHGEMPKGNKGTWLINDYRKEFGESYFVEEHCGHVHHEEAKMYNGIMVRSVLAQCGASYWEHKMGYRAERGIQGFVWNPETGLREQMYYIY